MPTIHIDEADDERLDLFRELKRHNLTRYSDQFVVEGRLLVERLLNSACEPTAVVTTEFHLEQFQQQQSIADDVPVYLLDKSTIDQLIGYKFHRGMMASARRPPNPSLSKILKRQPDQPSTVVVGTQILDPENLGSVIRNCAAFGATAFFLGPQSADPFSRRVSRVSMGTNLTLPIIETKQLESCLDELRHEHNYEIVATVLDESAEPLIQFNRARRTALLFGCEGFGIGAEWSEHVDRRVTLEMKYGTDSLNLATSTGVFLYHFTRVSLENKR